MAPGVYRFRDATGDVIYVGKAVSLRSRLASYFADASTLHPRTAAMVDSAESVDWVTVPRDLDALQLEYSWIKEYKPKFNVRYRDDKSFPFIAVTMKERYPRVFVTRAPRRNGVRYFGPYPQAWKVRDTLERLMLRTFPLRTCSPGVFRRHELLGRSCLLGDIGKCSAPCTGAISAADHREIAVGLCAFLEGHAGPVVGRLEQEMAAAASEERFEDAARIRDELGALDRALERSAVVLPPGTDIDAVAVGHDELQAAAHVFHVRDGRVIGQRGMFLDLPVEIPQSEVTEQVVMQVYGDLESTEVPKEIVIEVLPTTADAVTAWLGARRGRPVALRVPKRGAKLALLRTVAANAAQDLARSRLRRGSDLTSRGLALEELGAALGLPAAPLRIECVDVSSHAGEDAVASVVVFEDGLPVKSEYRRYLVSGDGGDVGCIREVVERRYRDDRVRRRYEPGLLLVDGGRPQVSAAVAAATEVGAVGLPIRGLAKRLEEIWAPGSAVPIVLSRSSEALYLLQRIRDESHRVAIRHHRGRSRRRLMASELDGIPGLGPARKAALLRQFRSVRRLRAATSDELRAVPGVGPALAAEVMAALKSSPRTRAVDLATGEIVDHA